MSIKEHKFIESNFSYTLILNTFLYVEENIFENDIIKVIYDTNYFIGGFGSQGASKHPWPFLDSGHGVCLCAPRFPFVLSLAAFENGVRDLSRVLREFCRIELIDNCFPITTKA